MIPLVATMRVAPAGRPGTWFFVPLPLFVLWLLLLPVAVVALPIYVIACLAVQIRPFRALSVLWQLLSALRATDVEVAHHGTSIHIHIH